MFKVIAGLFLIALIDGSLARADRPVCQRYEVSIEGQKPRTQVLCGAENQWMSESCWKQKYNKSAVNVVANNKCSLVAKLQKEAKQINVERGNPGYVLCLDLEGQNHSTQIRKKTIGGAAEMVWEGMACHSGMELTSHRQLMEMHFEFLKPNRKNKELGLEQGSTED